SVMHALDQASPTVTRHEEAGISKLSHRQQAGVVRICGIDAMRQSLQDDRALKGVDHHTDLGRLKYRLQFRIAACAANLFELSAGGHQIETPTARRPLRRGRCATWRNERAQQDVGVENDPDSCAFARAGASAAMPSMSRSEIALLAALAPPGLSSSACARTAS